MKHCLLYTALAVVVLAGPVAAHATSIDFLGSTLAFSRWSDFDAQRGSGTSCSPATISSYSWTIDNPTSTKTGNPVTFQWATSAGGTITLTVHCSNGTNLTKLRPVCFSFGVPGCVIPDSGYN